VPIELAQRQTNSAPKERLGVVPFELAQETIWDHCESITRSSDLNLGHEPTASDIKNSTAGQMDGCFNV
jgi:hypothetical protein